MLASCAEVSVTVKIAAHQIHLKIYTLYYTEKEQIRKVEPACSTWRPGNGMVDVNHHDAVLDLTALPHCLACGGEAKVDLEDRIPDLLQFTPAIVNQLPNLCAQLSLPDANPAVPIISATGVPIGLTQLLVPLINRERCALNKHHVL